MEKKDPEVVLILDDEEIWHRRWKREIGERVTILSVFTIEDAEKALISNHDISAMVIDACVPGDLPNTIPLIYKIRRSFSGPMIACSSIDFFREKLVRAGCDHETEKEDVPRKILEVLGL